MYIFSDHHHDSLSVCPAVARIIIATSDGVCDKAIERHRCDRKTTQTHTRNSFRHVGACVFGCTVHGGGSLAGDERTVLRKRRARAS